MNDHNREPATQHQTGAHLPTGASTAAWDQLLDAVRTSWPTNRWINLGVVVGVSGGADSVGALRGLHHLASQSGSRGFLVVAHLNHKLRGCESDQDACFVADLASDLGLKYVQEDATTQRSDEATLREMRHRFLLQTAKSAGARYIALAHSLDDNVETVLHNLMRGTGPTGLAGMTPARPATHAPPGSDFVIIRPLLGVRRQIIRRGLVELKQPWREDSSNADTKYRRNWIRNDLIPLMQTQFPSVVDAVGRAIETQADWRETIESLASVWIEKHVASREPLTIRRIIPESDDDPNNNVLSSDASSSAVVITSLQRLWTQAGWNSTPMNHANWQRLSQTISSNSNQRYSVPGDIDVVAEGGQVTLRATVR